MGILLLKGRGFLVAPCLRLNKNLQHIYPTTEFLGLPVPGYGIHRIVRMLGVA